jgi:hypothetical protein
MSIGYNMLGSNGRLGNQMFQYAALRGIAAHKNYKWVIPKPVSYGTGNYGLFECFEMFTVTEANFGFVNGHSVSTDCFHFNKEFFNNCPDDVNLHDYFQSEKYFINVEDIIRKDFEFKKEILNPCLEVIGDLKDPIFIHVRRGDYVNQPESHPVCPLSYYESALKYFNEESPIFVFSDDLEWCREHFTDERYLISTENVSYNHLSDTNDGKVKSFVPYYDLCLMSLCSGGIIANSSLSWWGAWLQKRSNNIIVAPKKWFGEKYSDFNMSDLFPSNWIQV